ncbi:MAG TPA: hypothetical protein VLG92_03695 [Candidatus Saccharimonadia bacterium]|nr:hypothetical protein [Candidatus Saccharimonadia bacterium]
MTTIEYPVDPELLRQEIATTTAGYEIRDGSIFYSKTVLAGFAIAATMMDGQTMEITDDGLHRPTLDTEALVVQRLGKDGISSSKGIITGFLDKLTVPANAPHSQDIVAACIATEFMQEGGQSAEGIAEMPLLRGGRYSYSEENGRRMHIITGALITPNGKPEIVGDGVEIGTDNNWSTLGALAVDAIQNPQNYTPDFAATTLPALLAGYPDLLQSLNLA